MSEILLRAGKSPFTVLTHEQSLATFNSGVFAANAGNMLFYSSVHRHVSTPRARVTTDGYLHERRQCTESDAGYINERYDHYVIPLADAFRKTFVPRLQRLTDLIQRLEIPVTVTGVGVALPIGAGPEQVDDEVADAAKAFVSAVLNRTNTIGVRGETTSEFLQGLGIPRQSIDVIGCPSLFMFGRPSPMALKAASLKPDSKVAFNFTPYVGGIEEFLQPNLDSYTNSVVIAQRHDRLATMLWGDPPPSNESRSLPVHVDHPMYLQDRIRFFVDAKTWIDYLQEFDFVVGTRLHGTIAGILAQTPSMLLAHDARTAELATYHGIPHKVFAEVDNDFDVAQLYDQLDLTAFDERQDVVFDRYCRFLDRNGIENIFQAGNDNPEYDRLLEDTSFPGPVHTLMASDERGRRQIIDRLSWLRQGQRADLARPAYANNPPIAKRSTKSDQAVIVSGIKSLRKDVRALEKQMQALNRKTNTLDRKQSMSISSRIGRVLRRFKFRR